MLTMRNRPESEVDTPTEGRTTLYSDEKSRLRVRDANGAETSVLTVRHVIVASLIAAALAFIITSAILASTY
jgi:hypothetical protein